jgi:bis(5'-nucleosidyl)-tetraphosphatase
MKNMKKEFSAGIIVYYEDTTAMDTIERQYLLLHYRKGYWDLPKGKLEESETNLDAAIRELHEETGLRALLCTGFEQPLSYIFKDMHGELVHKTVVYFVGRASTKEVVLSSEHFHYKWLPYKEALKQLTYGNAQQVLTMAERYVRSSLCKPL